MHKSETIGKLAESLAKAQAGIKSITKDRTNPHFRNRYATLDAILDAVRPTLAAQGLSIVQGASESTQGFNVETYLVHSSGEYIANVVAVPVSKQDAQGVGSAMTYGRRYGVSALLALSTDEDDDGEALAFLDRAPPGREASALDDVGGLLDLAAFHEGNNHGNGHGRDEADDAEDDEHFYKCERGRLLIVDC